MLNVCDLSTDGCFTFGAAVGAVVAVSGHPFLSIVAAMAAGVLSGFVTAILQTKLGVDSLLAGIIVNTALYSVNIAVMGGSSLINMNRTTTVFSMMKDTLYRNSVKRQRRYHHCGNRCDPRNPVSCIFPENKTRSCNQSNRK